ncbi:hypothetical protein BO94DRAFT_454102 [Aspergillus sclerotioniger CBS 115572]|uniref:Asteroid domain-containing protein n=1 Tax=Aspergillus sclerotioniger CBS 115572 TaxID=1450535 RepID=A0A317XH61_9EURO|nr:hypothetical protein BO94DRAFT_454102 [Aspergillus sclerotioniger CBS 115572]PWY96808.1 hypothetical protein BO94DRAFT_454102 [Aspergillus sclerotioniger CBS 115572]
MGIPFLTRHLYPFAESVVLGENQETPHSQVKSARAVVIDGPSLVYHVSMRLLSRSDHSLQYPDSQPTCDQISCGVMIYLLQLTILGVKIHNICFDGALPAQKRHTRFVRLEKSRRKLELLRSKPLCGFQRSGSPLNIRTINPEIVFQKRTLPAKYYNIPESPFIVPAVFEDLKYRWCRKNIASVVKDVPGLNVASLDDLPWADISVMVPGEADMYCAHLARLTGSAILTNDSDLLLHDLGTFGSVVLLDSVDLFSLPQGPQIRALRLCPALVAHRLGMPNLLPLAYEIKNHPDTGINQLIQRSKCIDESPEYMSGYHLFAEEYKSNPSFDQEVACQSYPQCFDPRVSELFSLYGVWSAQTFQGHPYMYLVVLNEDPTRQCAWVQGKIYRNMGYSALNISYPINERYTFIDEYVRRGGRITTDRISMGDKGWLLMEIQSLCCTLNTVHHHLGIAMASPVYWRMFALFIIYDGQTRLAVPSREHLLRFLTLGYMGKKLEWTDIHLLAQMQSVLYSLRILKQLLGFAGYTDEHTLQTRAILDTLPPLYILMRSIREMSEEFHTECSVSELVNRLLQLMEQTSYNADISTCGTDSHQYANDSAMSTAKINDFRPSLPRKNPSNIYELLSQQ